MRDKDHIDFSTILASIVHDVKNSLGVLLNSLDDLMETFADILPADRVGKLQYEARRVNKNLVQLLALYKMENKLLTARVDEHPVYDFLEEIVLEEKSLLESRGLVLEFDSDRNLMWYFDRDLLRGVLQNAVNNAMRYASRLVRIRAEEKGGYLVISVNDDGAGFSAAILNHSDSPGAAINFASGSTGLGLYFSARVAELHKNKDKAGFIELSNGHQLGGGCFTLCIP